MLRRRFQGLNKKGVPQTTWNKQGWLGTANRFSDTADTANIF